MFFIDTPIISKSPTYYSQKYNLSLLFDGIYVYLCITSRIEVVVEILCEGMALGYPFLFSRFVKLHMYMGWSGNVDIILLFFILIGLFLFILGPFACTFLLPVVFAIIACHLDHI